MTSHRLAFLAFLAITVDRPERDSLLLACRDTANARGVFVNRSDEIRLRAGKPGLFTRSRPSHVARAGRQRFQPCGCARSGSAHSSQQREIEESDSPRATQ